MRFLSFFSPFILLLAACQNMGSVPKQQTVVAVAVSDSTPIAIDEKPDTSAAPAATSSVLEYIESKTILFGAYRIWEEADDLALRLTGDWLACYLHAENMELQPLNPILEEGFDECAGVKTKALKNEHNSLLAIQLPKLKQGIYKTVNLPNNRIWPEEKVDFTFDGKPYQLAGFGDIANAEIATDEADDNDVFYAVANYELRLKDPSGRIISIVSEESFNDTFIEIKFIGDLDGDGRPDFIISAPRNYEEERVLLILSSEINGNVVRIYESSRQFDC